MSPSKGFTLLELLIVIALVSIIGGIGAPNLLEWIVSKRLKRILPTCRVLFFLPTVELLIKTTQRDCTALIIVERKP
jgi:prepilin-type N-terminal cleavage/methylation domain-containing protein